LQYSTKDFAEHNITIHSRKDSRFGIYEARMTIDY